MRNLERGARNGQSQFPPVIKAVKEDRGHATSKLTSTCNLFFVSYVHVLRHVHVTRHRMTALNLNPVHVRTEASYSQRASHGYGWT